MACNHKIDLSGAYRPIIDQIPNINQKQLFWQFHPLTSVTFTKSPKTPHFTLIFGISWAPMACYYIRHAHTQIRLICTILHSLRISIHIHALKTSRQLSWRIQAQAGYYQVTRIIVYLAPPHKTVVREACARHMPGATPLDTRAYVVTLART